MRPLAVLLLAASASAQGPVAGPPDTLHVAPHGTGTACTVAEPCPVSAALARLAPGTVVRMAGGVYREAIRPQVSGTAERPIVFEPEPGDSVVVTGADPAASLPWTRNADGTWSAPYPARLPHCAPAQTRPSGRCEVVLLDGRMLRHVEAGPLDAGTFTVSGDSRDPGTLTLRLPADADPRTADLEVGTREVTFSPGRRYAQRCGEEPLGHYVIRGITFTGSTARRQVAGLCPGTASTLEDVASVWNNAAGLILRNGTHTVTGGHYSDNAVEGLGSTGCVDCLVTGATIERNAFESDASTETHGGGGKHTRSVRFVFRDNRVLDNEGAGVWFDIDNVSPLIEGNLIRGNRSQGVFIELRSVGAVVRGNEVSHTRPESDSSPDTRWNGIGIMISASDSATVVGNYVHDNHGPGIETAGDDRAPSCCHVIGGNWLVDNARTSRQEVRLVTDPAALAAFTVTGNRYTEPAPGATSGPGTVMLPFTTAPDDRNLYTSDLAPWRALGLDSDGTEADHRVPSGFVPDPWRPAPDGPDLGALEAALWDALALADTLAAERDAARHEATEARQDAAEARAALDALRAALRDLLD